MTLTAFLDERGIHHPNANVSRRANYLFLRVVKLLKSKLVSLMETILQGLQLSCGEYYTCATSTSGDSFNWGDGDHNAGLLGYDTDVSHWIPKIHVLYLLLVIHLIGVMAGVQVLFVSCGT